MPHPIIGEQSASGLTLRICRDRGGLWAAYQNVDLGHREIGHMKFLQVGPKNTFKNPPERLPDTETELNWRYYHVGYLDLDTGKVVADPPERKEPS